jgi:hypothetical protein
MRVEKADFREAMRSRIAARWFQQGVSLVNAEVARRLGNMQAVNSSASLVHEISKRVSADVFSRRRDTLIVALPITEEK